MIITRVVSGRGCVEDWPTDGHRRAYTVALMLLEYVLPLVVIATAYVRIAAVLIRSRVPCGSLDRTLRAKKRAQKTRKENLQVWTLYWPCWANFSRRFSLPPFPWPFSHPIRRRNKIVHERKLWKKLVWYINLSSEHIKEKSYRFWRCVDVFRLIPPPPPSPRSTTFSYLPGPVEMFKVCSVRTLKMPWSIVRNLPKFSD